MNIFQHIAASDREQFVQLRRAFQHENRLMPNTMTEQPVPNDWPKESAPKRVWRSRNFAAQLFDQNGTQRLSVCRCKIDNTGSWIDGITWDELQRVKAECGFANEWAVEIFPPESQLVNVANMRHLFFVDAPAFAWKTKTTDIHTDLP